MTTIPADLGWLILAAFILITVTVYLASYEANRHATRWDRKWMKAREKEVKEAYQEIYDRSLIIDQRERAVQEREAELGRKAHDVAVQTHVVLRQANSPNRVPEMQEPPEPDRAYGNGETFILEGPPLIFDHKLWGPGFTVDEEAAAAKGWRRGEHEWVKDQQ